MAYLEGGRTPEVRRGRERLTVRNPRIETALASLNIDPINLDETRRFGNQIEAAVTRWRVGRDLFTADRRLTKGEAEAKLRALTRAVVVGVRANG